MDTTSYTPLVYYVVVQLDGGMVGQWDQEKEKQKLTRAGQAKIRVKGPVKLRTMRGGEMIQQIKAGCGAATVELEEDKNTKKRVDCR